MAQTKHKIALLTAGGLAPCLSAAVGYLIDMYTRKLPKAEIIGYRNGYMGLLKGWTIPVTKEVRKNALVLTQHGGSPIGNSRVTSKKRATMTGSRPCAITLSATALVQ